MICNNEVSYQKEHGWGYKEVFVKCGNTDIYGNRAICEECENNPVIMESIRNHEKNIRADNEWLRSAGWGEM